MQLILPPTTPWKREPAIVPRHEFGVGCNKPFSWYFEGDTQARIRSLHEALRWLKKCDYVSDKELFMEEDFWQHPVTFEALRKGDCEDHALWVWRKLYELNYYAEFVSGTLLKVPDNRTNYRQPMSGHAWVHFLDFKKGQWFVLESVAKRSEPILISAKESHEYYDPKVSVNRNGETFRFMKW